MAHFLLFIRDHGSEDILDFHPDKPAARQALIGYVRRQADHSGQSHPINDDVAIKRYFARRDATYAIARVEPASPGPAR